MRRWYDCTNNQALKRAQSTWCHDAVSQLLPPRLQDIAEKIKPNEINLIGTPSCIYLLLYSILFHFRYRGIILVAGEPVVSAIVEVSWAFNAWSIFCQ